MDWFASVLILISLYVIGRKQHWGWLLGIVGGIIYFYISISNELYGMAFKEVCLIILSFYNFVKWK